VTGFVVDVFVRTGIVTSRSSWQTRAGQDGGDAILLGTGPRPTGRLLERRTLIIGDMSLRKGAVFAQAFSVRSFTRCLTRDGWPRVGRFQITSLIAGRLVGKAR
jgi:hypothetical protein